MEKRERVIYSTLEQTSELTCIRLHEGDLVEGEVIGMLENSMMKVRLKGIAFQVESMRDLRPGDRIILCVTALEPRITFRLLYKKRPGHGGIEARV